MITVHTLRDKIWNVLMEKRDNKYMKKRNCILLTVLCLVLSLTGCTEKTKEPINKMDFLLNTFVSVTLYDTDKEEILDGALDVCREYENVLSTTIDTSEIYQMNHRKPGERQFTVSDKTAEVLKKGLEYCEMSGGAFDITIEPLSSLWDFAGADPAVPESTAIQAALEKVGYKKVLLEGNTVTFADDDTAIDLGAIAKGYIADRIKDYLTEQGVRSAIINLGGNVVCVGEKTDGKPFKIGLQKPFADRTETVAALDINDLSVVSSGVYERHFIQDGVNYHHILDPHTGYPYENGLTQVTIISKLSVDGDGLSTSCFALGLENGMKLADSLEGVYAVFITEDGELHYSEGAQEFLSSD